MRSIYMDHAATTPLDQRVLQAMMPYMGEYYGNPSSVHKLGRRARFAVEESREQIAGLLNAEPGEIIFTSGGTEANNTALWSLVQEGDHLVTSEAEHEAVLEPAAALRQTGRKVTLLTPQSHGAVTPDQVAAALTDDTALVSLMLVNNEIGTITPIAEIASLCREREVLLHCDAVQVPGLLTLDIKALGVDLLSLSAHKFYGPKGVGLLYVRGGVDLTPFLRGGSQERDRRAGTENVPAIVGMAEALDRAVQKTTMQAEHVRALRDRLYKGIREALNDDFLLNTPVEWEHGESVAVAPHILNISFAPVEGEPLDGEMLLLNLDMEGIHASAGSACTSGALEPSHVLTAIGRDTYTGSAAVRFSLGRSNTEDDVDHAVHALSTVIERMRKQANVPSVNGTR